MNSLDIDGLGSHKFEEILAKTLGKIKITVRQSWSFDGSKSEL